MPTAEQTLTKDQAAEVDRWVLDPLYWATRFLGKDFDPSAGQIDLWNAYGQILTAKIKRYQLGQQALTPDENALADKLGISVMSGHGQGKERSIVSIALHFFTVLKCYRPIVACTAPAGPTLFNTMWREFTNVITGSEYLPALVEKLANKIYLKEDPDKGDLIRIVPRTIQQNSNPEQQGEVLAGMHSTAIMYCITEASGVEEPVFKPIIGGMSDPIAMAIMIFNPTRRTGTAYDSHARDRKYWYCLHWDARKLKQEKLANPGRFKWFNERAQDVLIEKYGEDSDTVRIRVIGLPAQQAADTLIHYDAAMAASERQIHIMPSDPLCIGVDVGGGGSGGDPSIVVVLRGPKMTALYEFNCDESKLADHIAGILSAELANLSPDAQYAIGVDYVGLGRLVYNHLQEKHLIRNVQKVDVSESPIRDSEFHRMRDEVWWELREAFMENKEIVINPKDEEGKFLPNIKADNFDALIAQLTSIKWASVFLASSAKIKVQGKGSSSGIPNVKPLLHSPNEADALGIAWRMFRHYCSTVPMEARRTLHYRRPAVSWKAM